MFTPAPWASARRRAVAVLAAVAVTLPAAAAHAAPPEAEIEAEQATLDPGHDVLASGDPTSTDAVAPSAWTLGDRVAVDTFERSQPQGWGSANQGGSYRSQPSSMSRVSPRTGLLTLECRRPRQTARRRSRNCPLAVMRTAR